MAAANPILTPDRGKAHSVALAVLCVLAVAQVAAMVRAVWLVQKKDNGAAVAGVNGRPAADDPLAGAPPLPASAITRPLMSPPSVPVPGSSSFAPPPIPSSASVPGFTAPRNLPVASAPSVPMRSASTNSATKPAAPVNAEIKELLDLAQQLRPLGDSKGALEVLRKAETIEPNNVEVLKELALTYEVMGLKDKAAATRDRVAALRSSGGASLPPAAASMPIDDAGVGSTIGGGLSSDAGRGLSSPAMGGLSTPEARPHDPSKALSIGRCELLRDRGTTRGEKVTLRLPIRSQPGQVIDPTAIDIDVFFFDLVNGEKVEQTKADVPVNTWVDAPVDWKDGIERLDVVYSMPEMTADVIRSIGQRRFHGYIVKLYYQHKLQDTVMEPASLQHFGTGNAPQPTGNPLLPPVAR